MLLPLETVVPVHVVEEMVTTAIISSLAVVLFLNWCDHSGSTLLEALMLGLWKLWT